MFDKLISLANRITLDSNDVICLHIYTERACERMRVRGERENICTYIKESTDRKCIGKQFII